MYRAALKRIRDGGEMFFLALFKGDEARAMRQVAEKYERIR